MAVKMLSSKTVTNGLKEEVSVEEHHIALILNYLNFSVGEASIVP